MSHLQRMGRLWRGLACTHLRRGYSGAAGLSQLLAPVDDYLRKGPHKSAFVSLSKLDSTSVMVHEATLRDSLVMPTARITDFVL